MNKVLIIKGADFSKHAIGVNVIDDEDIDIGGGGNGGEIETPETTIPLTVTWCSNIGTHTVLDIAVNHTVSKNLNLNERYVGYVDVTNHKGKLLTIKAALNVNSDRSDNICFASNAVSLSGDATNVLLTNMDARMIGTNDGTFETSLIYIPNTSGSLYFYFVHKVAASGVTRDNVEVYVTE